ncbi:hypothetical protein AnigIFM63326_003536 [Aspergillus niger]|nr:hypothetical protein AnigIFM63326_003536 [Aspergillus niger]
MDYIPCSFDAFIDNFLACYRPCYSDYLQQLVANGTCGANYTTLAASTDRSDLKCICENANGVSNNWTSQVLECTHSSCNGTFNYTRWADMPWLTSYFDRGGGLACRKALYRLGSQRIIIPFRENPGPFHMLNTSPRPFREVVYNKPIRRFIQLRSAPTGPSALPVPAISEMLDGPLSPLVGNR